MVPAVTGGTFTATITFSEDVTDFTLTEITVTNGFPANLVPISASVYTATITPLLYNEDDLTVSVPADIALDEAENNNLASNTVTIGVDSTAPTLTSILRGMQTPTSPTNADVLWWTFQFSEDILNIDVSDFVVTGTIGTISYVGEAAGGSSFALTVSDGDLAGLDGDVTIALAPGNDITDQVGNALGDTAPIGTNEDTFTVDNTRPSAEITMTPSATNGAFTVDFTFSEDVTGFVIGDISAFNGTVSNFSGLGTSYKATITPVGNGDITVGVDAGVATDAATNENTAATEVTVIVDQISPNVTITDVPTLTNTPFTATFTFTEDVSGFALADINVGNGTASQLAGGAAVYTALITPDTDGEVTVDVAAGIAQDAVGNHNTVATQAKASFDGTAPSVSIKMAPSITNSTFDADIEFSEDVTGFVLGDITVTNGTASDFSGSGDAYKATINPDGNGNITVAVNAGVAIDEATNENTAAEDVIVTVDTVAPVIESITRLNPTTETSAADSLTWRVTFSEDVKNVNASDFSVAGTTASLSLQEQATKAYDKRDSANVFDITITGGDLEDLNTTVTLSIASTQDITDTIGNALSNTQSTGTNDNTFKVQNDVTPPTLTITGVPEAVDGPFTAKFSFSEEVQDFTEEDIVVTNGTTSNFQNTSDSTGKTSDTQKFAARPGNEFTVLITPAREGALTITVSERTLTDIAGNLNVAQVTTATVIDSTAPTVVIGALPNDVRGPFVVSVTFNEDVTGFELTDLTLTNATGSDFTSISDLNIAR